MPAGKRFFPRVEQARWLLWLPAAVLIAFVLSLGGMFYVVFFDWQDERRDSLIQDILWLEQSMRSQLTEQQDWAVRTASEVGEGTLDEDRFQAASELILRENPEILSVELLNAQGQVEARAPSQFQAEHRRQPLASFEERDAFDVARRQGQPAFSNVYYSLDKQARVDLEAPVYRDHRFAGSVRLSYSLPGMLHHEVPWWIGQKYQIAIVDLGGKVIAAKFTVGERPGSLWHEIDFTPPGNGLRLRATAYHLGMGLAFPLLAGLMGLLLLLLGVSLWKIRQHIRRRHKVESMLREEMALRAAMEDSMKNGLIVMDPRGTIVRVNRAFCEMTGRTAEALIGQTPPYTFWPTEHLNELHGFVSATLAGDMPPHGFELPFLRADGESFWVRLYATPLINHLNQQTGWLASMYNITELKKKREAIAQAHQRFRTVLNGLDAAVCVSRCEDRQLLFSNRAFEENMVRASEDAPFCVVLPWPDDEGIGPLADVVDCDLQFNGSTRWYQLHRRRIEWVDGEPAWLGIYADITEARAFAERERLQAEKLQTTARLMTMGELASSLAHELNQPLAAIASYAAGCLNRIEQTPALPAVQLATPLDKIARQARRAGEIIHGIRAFVKKREPKLARLAVSELLEHTLTLAGPMLSQHRVAFHIECDDGLTLDADRVLLEQVLLNLVNNAVEAMRDGKVARPTLTLTAHRQGERMRLSVSDNGPGLNPAVAEQLFTPFFTTKQEGMGIGLNICRSIIEYHRGEFGHASNPEGGCVFWLELPLN